MPNPIQGTLSADGLQVGIIVSRFNSLVTDRLLQGALDAITQLGGDVDATSVYRVPGAFEMPGLAARLCERKRVDALICLGAVIRGATPHFDYVAGAVAKGLSQVQVQHAVALSFGVLTTDTMEQALDRAGGKAGNKGHEAASAAIELANMYRALRG